MQHNTDFCKTNYQEEKALFGFKINIKKNNIFLRKKNALNYFWLEEFLQIICHLPVEVRQSQVLREKEPASDNGCCKYQLALSWVSNGIVRTP